LIRGDPWALVKFESSDPLQSLVREQMIGVMDVNKLAFKIVQQSIGEAPIKKRQPATAQRGLQRAAKLTKEQRVSIARKAAQDRWKKTKDSTKP
jgi:hypothetical protein